MEPKRSTLDGDAWMGPWQQGRLLNTRQTERWSEAARSVAQESESLCVFANFTAEDEGRSRVLIARAETAEYARLISAAPELLEALKLARSIIGHPDDAIDSVFANLIAKAEGK